MGCCCQPTMSNEFEKKSVRVLLLSLSSSHLRERCTVAFEAQMEVSSEHQTPRKGSVPSLSEALHEWALTQLRKGVKSNPTSVLSLHCCSSVSNAGARVTPLLLASFPLLRTEEATIRCSTFRAPEHTDYNLLSRSTNETQTKITHTHTLKGDPGSVSIAHLSATCPSQCTSCTSFSVPSSIGGT